MTNSMTKDALGIDGMDIETIVEISTIMIRSPNSNVAPLKRAINIHAMTINKLVPFVFKLFPMVRTKLEIRGSHFILSFMQCKAVGNVTALKEEQR